MYFNYKLYRDIFRFLKMCRTPLKYFTGDKIIKIIKIIKNIKNIKIDFHEYKCILIIN